MFKPEISFKTRKWTCKHCGLLKNISKLQIKAGTEVFFNIRFFNKNFDNTLKTISGTTLDRQNNFLTIIDKKNQDIYFIDQAEVQLKYLPALFLYNMYGKCVCYSQN